MDYGSVCSGIEAATVAWHPLGMQPAWVAEIEPFPSAVLAHHYPSVPNLGDMTKIADQIRAASVRAPAVLVGGTPCQAFSVAGLRKSLGDSRGQLSLAFCELANAIDAVRVGRGEPECIIVWENVPGVLNTKDNAFGCFLAGLAGEDCPLVPPGGKWTNAGYVSGPTRAVAWRVMDAQFFGLAQRRRRVFVVASARDGFDPSAILFEWEGVRRDSAPSREAGERVAPCLDASFARLQGCSGQDLGHGHLQVYGGNNTGGAIDVGPTLLAKSGTRMDFASEALIAFHCDAQVDQMSFDALTSAPLTCSQHSAVCQPLPFDTTQITSKANYSKPQPGDPCHPLASGAHPPAIAFQQNQLGEIRTGEITGTLNTNSNASGRNTPLAQVSSLVRRLTPTECERLQGFPDGYTLVPYRNKPACDGPRYKALGNSMAVPCMRWIGERILSAL